MAVNAVSDGSSIIPILATANGDELYAFLKRAFEAVLLDRFDAPDGKPAYMTIQIGNSRISAMRPLEERQPTCSAFYGYVADADLV